MKNCNLGNVKVEHILSASCCNIIFFMKLLWCSLHLFHFQSNNVKFEGRCMSSKYLLRKDCQNHIFFGHLVLEGESDGQRPNASLLAKVRRQVEFRQQSMISYTISQLLFSYLWVLRGSSAVKRMSLCYSWVTERNTFVLRCGIISFITIF